MGNLRTLRALRADGTEIPIEASISTTKAGGRTIYTVILRDITARQTAEDVLRESEARFRGTFENAAVGVGHAALDGTWLEVNDRLCEISGYSREELLTRGFQDITHPHDLAADLNDTGRLLAEEIPHYTMDKRLRDITARKNARGGAASLLNTKRLEMKKADVEEHLSRRSRELAESGDYDDYTSIEFALRAEGYPEARGFLDSKVLR